VFFKALPPDQMEGLISLMQECNEDPGEILVT